MSNADQIKQDIERTRADLGEDVDALADKVRPSSIAQRQVGKVRSALAGVRERVMGTASDIGDTAGSAASAVGETVAGAPRAVARTAQGNPIAVGLIAFGVGALVASLLPASDKERQLAQSVKEQAQPLVGELGDAARQVGETLREPAAEAVDSVKSAATEAVDNVRTEGAEAVDEVKQSGSDPRGSTGAG